MGIGGWFISSNSVSWFAETWQFQEVQEQWPRLTKEAQRSIACFETEAVTKILTLGVCLFPCVLILVESSAAWPFLLQAFW